MKQWRIVFEFSVSSGGSEYFQFDSVKDKKEDAIICASIDFMVFMGEDMDNLDFVDFWKAVKVNPETGSFGDIDYPVEYADEENKKDPFPTNIYCCSDFAELESWRSYQVLETT